MSSREAILARIRAAQKSSPSEIERIINTHERGPQPAPIADLVARFSERATALSSHVLHAPSRQQLPILTAAYLAEHNLGKSVLCWPEFLDLDWLGARLSVAARPPELDDPVGITGAFCGIAETGTLMMLSGQATPAATSLVPETHIAVLGTSRILATMEDAWARLRQERGSLPRAVNFISGPSRTADIEQTITLGAHGPARVCIILVGE